MKHKSKIHITTLILIAVMLACSLPGAAAPQESAPEIQTAAAQTLQVIFTTSVTATVQPSSIIATTPSATSSPTSVSTITPTYSVPMLTVREQTNCRTGPGQDYEVVFTYLSGKKLEIVGRYDPDNYWLVKSGESPTGTCWLWDEYVEVTGSYWAVSSVTPPPTATIPPPQAPSLKWDVYCNYAADQMEFSLKWTDNANNEVGYRILHNGQPVADLPANSTAYDETIVLVVGEKVIYQIEVYNATGATRSAEASYTC